MVAVLDKDLQESGTHCFYCLRLLHKATAVKSENDLLGAVYCSKECQLKEKYEINFLFGSESILPPQLDDGTWVLSKDKRAAAQAAFISALNKYEGNNHSILARFIAKQVGAETMKLAGGTTPQPDVAEPEGQYTMTDHMDRLRYIELAAPEDLENALKDYLGAQVPGLEATFSENKYAVFLGKLAFNVYGVCFSGGRDDRVSVFEPHAFLTTDLRIVLASVKRTSREPGAHAYATRYIAPSRQRTLLRLFLRKYFLHYLHTIRSILIAPQIAHSCDPNARPSFSAGTAELHLVATKPIKKGEEITVAYVDVTKHDDETEEAARRRRRFELARGWRFKCECTRCLAEASEAHIEADKELGDVGKDGSKLEALVQRVENGEAAIPGIGID